MAYNFLPVERDQSFLLPPSMRDWLPEYLDLALASARSGWNEAEHAAEDQVEDGEQHRAGILRERASRREQDFRPLSPGTM